MKLLRKSERFDKNRRRTFSIFYCEFCDSEVERDTRSGIRNNSCGCLRMINHRESGTLLYKAWCDMRYRCNRKANKSYKYYGGRGIKVCEEWMIFSNFKKWATENGYREGLEIDRRENDGNYEPSNCRFVTHAQNSHNTRNNKLSWPIVDFIRSSSSSIGELAKTFNVSTMTIRRVINKETWIPKL